MVAVVWAQEIVVAVRDIDRRVLRIQAAEEFCRAWAHKRRLLAMDVVDAEGFDDGAVGEERTEGKRTNGDIQ